MKVHHLNGATMRPPLVGRMVCHVLLCESDTGLVLVDTGLGLADIADPRRRLGPVRHLLRPQLRDEETLVRQIVALGHAPEDVRHIVLTHLDLDHIGGLADFPWADVHLTAAEHAAATDPPTRVERHRYRSAQWAHGPNLVTYGEGGDRWQGFAGVHQLAGVDERITLVPLPGHSRGHAAVALDLGADRWLLHAGDAVFDRAAIARPDDPADDHRRRRLVRAFERIAAIDRTQVAANHARLAALHARQPRSGGGRSPEVTVLSSHDPVLFDRAVATSRTGG